MTAHPPSRRLPASLHVARGFDFALKTIGAVLDQLAEAGMTEEQKSLIGALRDILDELSQDEEDLKFKPTNSELARRFSVSVRTITNWRREGCDFDSGKWGVWRWLREERIIPAGAKVVFGRLIQRQKERAAQQKERDQRDRFAKEVKATWRQVQALTRAGLL